MGHGHIGLFTATTAKMMTSTNKPKASAKEGVRRRREFMVSDFHLQDAIALKWLPSKGKKNFHRAGNG